MAQEKPSTPEKQLLNLIEDPKERDLNQKKVKRGSFSLFSMSALKGRLSFLISSIRSGSFIKKIFFDIKGLNQLLKVSVVLLLCYMIVNFSMAFIRQNELPDFTVKNMRSPSEVRTEDLTTLKISDYLDGPKSRNIFRFGDAPREEKQEEEEEVFEEVAPPVEAPLSKAEELAINLELVGIGWSANPDVMVKDANTNKMYFLKRGDRIESLIKVEAIFQDKVILTYGDGEEMELR